MKSLIQIFKSTILLLLAITLAACGAVQNPVGRINGDDERAARNHTGATKITMTTEQKLAEVPYTTAGSQKIFNDMRKEMESVTDVLLAKTIENASVRLLDDKNELVEANPQKIELTVNINAVHSGLPNEIEFKSPLVTQGNYLVATNIAQTSVNKKNFPFAADIKCHDLNCRVIEIRLKKYPIGTNLASLKNIQAFGQVGILYRSSYPKVRIQQSRERDGSASPSFAELQKSLATNKAIRTSVVVVNGPSYSRLEVKDLLKVDTELLDTEETSIAVKKVSVKEDTNLTGRLSGNDPTTGSLVVDITNNDTQDMARIFFVEDDASAISDTNTSPSEPKPVALPPRSGKSLFHAKQNATEWPETARVSTAFDQYAADPQVQKFVKAWLGSKEVVGCKNINGKYLNTPSGFSTLKSFLTYAPSIAPHLEKVVEKLDVTPDIGYLLLIESPYAKSRDYPARAFPGKSLNKGALGPWQIVYNTALHIVEMTKPKVPFKVFASKAANLLDDRTYFLNSTYMAGIYLEWLFDSYKEDPAMAIMAYNGGIGTTNISKDKTNAEIKKHAQPYAEFKTTLAEIQQYNMQTKTNCEHINYAYTFLAARTIGQNLEYYDLGKITPSDSKAYIKSLKSPNGTLPAGL